MAVCVEFDVACATPGMPPEVELGRWIEQAADGAGRARGEVEIGVRIVDELESRQLNHRYRGKDSPTNVLAFPAGDHHWPEGIPVPLGDLVVCAPVVAREAREQGKREADHWAHMLVHGTLHLLGFDHETGTDAEAMEALEIRVLEAGGLQNPYEDKGFT